MGISTHQKMGIAAIIMAMSIFLSRIMGLVRDKVISWQFGAGSESDIYFTAFVVPDFINHLLAGGYISITLIPLLSQIFEKDEKDGWKFFGAVSTWALLLIVLFTGIAYVAAPELSALIAPGFSEEQIARLAHFLRIILPAQIFFILGSCFTAILYIRKQFTIPALTPLIYNGAIIAGGLIYSKNGMEGYCWGVLVGAGIGALILPMIAVARGGLVFLPSLKHPKLLKMVLLALPLMLGLSVTVMDEQLIRVFGSMVGEGAVSLLNYARRIMMVPVGVVAQAAGIASFPFLAALIAKRDMESFDQTLRRTLVTSFYVVLPITFCMIAASEPILGFLFEGGRFSAEMTKDATPLLRIMLISVPFWMIHQIVSRSFYAMQDTLTPAVVGTAVTIVVFLVYPHISRQFGATGVASCAAGSIIVYTIALCLAWIHKHGASIFKNIFNTIGRPIVISILSCVLACGALDYATDWGLAVISTRISDIIPISPFLIFRMITGALACIVFTLSYIALALYACPDALIFTRRFKKKDLSANQ